jgi:PAS domain S-box-containing protein
MSEKPTYEELEQRIRELEKIDAERKRKEEALRKSEKYFRLMFMNAPVPYQSLDEHGDFIDVNQTFINVLGYTKEELIGKNFGDFLHPDYVDHFRTNFPTFKAVGEIIGVEFKMLKKDGSFIIVNFHGKIQRNGKGRFQKTHCIFQDVTAFKRAEEERAKLQEQLNQALKMEAIGTLAGGIAHNFNNILMGIQGRASLMMLYKNTSDPDYEHLKEIKEYIKNAAELTRDLLGFARGGKYEVKPMNLNTLIKHENRMFGHTKKEILIHGKYENNLWTVEVDQSQMQQTFLNLYLNACQAMPGGGDLYIQTENVILKEKGIKPFEIAPGRYVKISVTDTGVGMNDATRRKIFEPFFTTRDAQGSGLGLASVYGIIKNHGGFINVYSEERTGTTFNIYLPASEKEVTEKCPVPDTQELLYGRGTIILVDDEEIILYVGQRMLENLGYRVIVAGSGQDALDVYKKHKEEIILVILDMIMPGMGSGKIYERLKAINEDVKVLLASGYSINRQAQAILDRGCNGFIQKPFSMEELSRKIFEVLDEDKSDAQQ